VAAQQPVQRVEVRFARTPSARQIERASGVSEVKIDGRVVRRLVAGSFQPFLDAPWGHEVINLQSAPAVEPTSSTDVAGGH
jgi:hypothetical protein